MLQLLLEFACKFTIHTRVGNANVELDAPVRSWMDLVSDRERRMGVNSESRQSVHREKEIESQIV